MTPFQLFTEGRLREALLQAKREIDRKSDDSSRLLLIELHLFAGEIDSASRLLDEFETESPPLEDYLSGFRRLLRAENKRQRILSEGQPGFLTSPPEHLLHRLDALLTLREGDIDSVIDLLDEADAEIPPISGHIDGREFEEIRNADDLFASFLEVIVDEDYLWVPWEAIRKLRLEKCETPRDHLFIPGLLTLQDQRVVEVLLPSVYLGTTRFTEEELLLGRGTDWTSEDGGPIRGIGSQLLEVGEEELTFHDFRQLEIRLN